MDDDEIKPAPPIGSQKTEKKTSLPVPKRSGSITTPRKTQQHIGDHIEDAHSTGRSSNNDIAPAKLRGSLKTKTLSLAKRSPFVTTRRKARTHTGECSNDANFNGSSSDGDVSSDLKQGRFNFSAVLNRTVMEEENEAIRNLGTFKSKGDGAEDDGWRGG